MAFLHTYKATIYATYTLRYEDIPVARQRRVHPWLRERLGWQGTTEQDPDKAPE